MDKSKLNLLFNMLSSRPNSVDVTVSGFKSGFNLTLGEPKVVSPR